MEVRYETDKFPVIKAKWFSKSQNKREVRLVVIHSVEAPEKPDTAENVAKYFQGLPATKKASAHLCIDSNSIVQSVFDNDVAYAAPGANSDGLQIELAGYAKQKRMEWLDPYGILMIENAANATAQYCLKYDIPYVHLTNQQLSNNEKGIVGHYQVSEVYKKSDHNDPGDGFPWDLFIERVAFYYTERKKKLDSV
jgi:N-acetyl-anhydromuramyl-L-alanine amidase AmpD